jgi:hypothetical protein
VDLAADPTLELVHDALHSSLQQQQTRLFHWLSFLYDPTVIRRVRDAVTQAMAPTAQRGTEQIGYALETLDLLITADFKAPLLALLEDQPLPAKLTKLGMLAPQPQLKPAERLHAILLAPPAWVTPWLHAAALYKAPTVAGTVPAALRNALHAAVHAAQTSPNALVLESACWAAAQFAAFSPAAQDEREAAQVIVKA